MKLLSVLIPVLALTAVLLAACTLAPPLRTEGYPTYDASTPPQYPQNSSGILGMGRLGGHEVLMISRDRAKGDPAAVLCRDRYGNRVYAVPPDHYAKPYNAAIDAQKQELEKL